MNMQISTEVLWTPLAGLLQWAHEQPEAIYLSQPADGQVTDYSWAEVAQQVRRMAAALREQQPVAGARIAVLSRNCAHSIMAELAIWMAGHVSVPIYPSLAADTMKYILEHSGTSLMFLGGIEDWASMGQGLPSSLPLILLPGAPGDGLSTQVSAWNDVIGAHAPLQELPETAPDQLAKLIYTSGSTGQPKGVMISYGAIAANSVLGNLTTVTPQDRMLSYLPLAHAFEASVVMVSSLRHGFHIYFSEGLATFTADLRRARPTIFLSVPRLWVKFQQAVLQKIPQTKLDALLADPQTGDATRRQLLEQLGLQDTRIAISGSAPLAPSIIEWYRNLGLELLEGYGMTEDFAYSHVSLPGRARVGYVGHPLSGVQRRIDESGEVQIKSPASMLGYYREPAKTVEALTEDGWFRTGDLGEVDEDGRLRITGRLKELFKTSKGKYVAPAPIENKLAHPLIEAVCVTGANLPQPLVLMMPGADARPQLAGTAERERFETEISALLENINATLDPHEQLSCAVIVPEQWTIANGMLTPTMKIRRNILEKQYEQHYEDWQARGHKVLWV